MTMTGNEIRETFLKYFEQHGHTRVRSSPLLPANDPTLLFTNAGMNQFKDVFLGLEKRDYTRATSSQKCVRAGGKHNDLENVGFTNRHHTFFEMLGNFSFGDYFKKDAIAYAWELITAKDWFGIDKNKLYVTIFKGEGPVPRDVEAYNLWLAQGVAKNRIFESDCFGPLIERAPEGRATSTGNVDPGLRPGRAGEGPRPYAITATNHVAADAPVRPGASDAHGGTGVPPVQAERSSAAISKTSSGASLRRAGEGTRPYASSGTNHVWADALVRPSEQKSAASLRVIADHSRAATFLISDGVLPSNEGRGYVLRKIIRRAITHGRLLGQTKPFLHEMVFAVRDLMQDAYPELKETAGRVSKAVLAEEQRFARTVDLGLKKLEEDILEIAADKESAQIDIGKQVVFPGERAFKLYDTFGLPLDFIEDVLRDQGIPLIKEGFDRAMAEQRERARASWKGAAKQTANPAYQQLPKSVFEGYLQTRSEDCEVLAIIKNGQGVQELRPGEEGEVILDHTPFYAESGGQVGDRGVLYSDELNTVVAEVKGCYYPVQGVRAHQVLAKQPIRVGDKVDAVVDTAIRQSTMRNHTATHLLHAGLREVLGKHVKQAGSLVAPNHLRFDFSHFTAVEDEELQDIEDMINKEVLRNQRVEVIENVPIDVAVNECKAMALFGEKYGDRVRVIKIGDFSTELCGGTHTGATGEIGLIKILKEGSVSSGVRRVEAVTGEGSLRHFIKDHELETVVSRFVVPTLAQKTRKDGAPSSEEATTSPAEALRAELEKKDAEIKRLAPGNDQPAV